jgi:hypothetical protein
VLLQLRRERILAVRGALVGVASILLIAVLPTGDSAIAKGAMLLALWLTLGSVLVYGIPFGIRLRAPRTPTIPLRFSGPTGRFALRRRGDGRQIEIVSEGRVLAEVTATDARDEIALHAPVPPDALDELGSALGQAMTIAADADAAHLDWDDHGASADWSDQPDSRSW